MFAQTGNGVPSLRDQGMDASVAPLKESLREMIMRHRCRAVGFVEDRIDTVELQPVLDDAAGDAAEDGHVVQRNGMLQHRQSAGVVVYRIGDSPVAVAVLRAHGFYLRQVHALLVAAETDGGIVIRFVARSGFVLVRTGIGNFAAGGGDSRHDQKECKSAGVVHVCILMVVPVIDPVGDVQRLAIRIGL